MNKILHCFFVVISLIVFTQANAQHIRPINKMAREVAEMLSNKKFDELEAMAQNFRDKNISLSDGQPALSGFYSGVSKCVEMQCGDERLPNEIWINHRKLLDEWNSKYPQSITAQLALAKYIKEYAWYIRGVGFSNTVSDVQFKQFAERIEESRVYLVNIKNKAIKDPVWYDTMLSIAKIQHPHSKYFDDLYLEAVSKFPYYLPLYFTKASEVSPKWGGSLPLFRSFVDETVDKTRSKLGETMYARLNWSNYDPQMFKNGQTDWNRMKSGFLTLTKNYPDPWNINNFAKFSCVAQDITTLKTLMLNIGDSPIEAAWGSEQFYDYCKSMALLN